MLVDGDTDAGVPAGLSAAAVEDLHARAAAEYQRAGYPAERVGAHLLECRAGRYPWASTVLSGAAEAAVARGRYDLARRYLARALREYPLPPATRARLLVALSRVEYPTDPEVAVRHLRRAMELLPTPTDCAVALAALPLGAFHPDAPAARDLLAGVRVPEPVPRPAGGAAGAPTAPVSGGDRPDADPVDGEAGPVSELVGGGDRPNAEPDGGQDAERGVAAGRGALELSLEARIRLADGAPDAAATAARLRELVRGPVDGAPERELATVLAYQLAVRAAVPAADLALPADRLLAAGARPGRSPAAEPHADDGLVVVAAVSAGVDTVEAWLREAVRAGSGGDRRERARVHGWRSLAARHRGKLADAWSAALDACDMVDDGAAGVAGVAGGMVGGAADAAAPSQDWVAALGLLSAALEMGDDALTRRVLAACPPTAARGVPAVGACRAALVATTATPERLPALLDELDGCARELAWLGWHNPVLFPVEVWAAGVRARLGDTRGALELVAAGTDRARDFGAPDGIGRALRAWGELVGGRYAISLLTEAVTVLRGGADRIERIRALRALADRLTAAGRPGAGDLLAEADGLVAEAGTAWLVHWAPPDPPRRSGAAGPGTAAGAVPGTAVARVVPGTAGFGETERAVAGLVARGRTNAEIADRLGVSQRAVERHLTGWYRRAGVHHRADLVPVLRRIAGRVGC